MNMITIAQQAVRESINEFGEAEFKDWGFSYYTRNEGVAFKIAYAYRNSK